MTNKVKKVKENRPKKITHLDFKSNFKIIQKPKNKLKEDPLTYKRLQHLYGGFKLKL